MTDERVIKAWKKCIDEANGCCGDDTTCPYCREDKNIAKCFQQLRIDILNVIKRQQAEIEKLTAENKKIHKAWSEDLQDKIKFLHKKNEQLDDLRLEKYGIKSVNKAVPVTKATERYIERKAYKEFAEEFEKRCIASGIYPAITKDLLKNLVKEKTEGNA